MLFQKLFGPSSSRPGSRLCCRRIAPLDASPLRPRHIFGVVRMNRLPFVDHSAPTVSLQRDGVNPTIRAGLEAHWFDAGSRGFTRSCLLDPSGRVEICQFKSPRKETYSYRSATYAVSGEPLSANTSGTLNPIHCDGLGSRPRFAAASGTFRRPPRNRRH